MIILYILSIVALILIIIDCSKSMMNLNKQGKILDDIQKNVDRIGVKKERPEMKEEE